MLSPGVNCGPRLTVHKSGSAVKLILAALAALAALPVAAAADPKLPTMVGKVGDTVVYRVGKTISGETTLSDMRVTLTALDKAAAGVEAKMVVAGVDSARLPTVRIPGIPVGVGLDPAGVPDNRFAKLEAKPTVLASGQETVTVAGKKLACEWVELKVTEGAGEAAEVVVTKYWLSKGVPVTGLVKAEVRLTAPGIGEMTTTYRVLEFTKR